MLSHPQGRSPLLLGFPLAAAAAGVAPAILEPADVACLCVYHSECVASRCIALHCVTVRHSASSHDVTVCKAVQRAEGVQKGEASRYVTGKHGVHVSNSNSNLEI